MNGAKGLHVYLKSHRNQHSIVKQLSSKNKNKLKKKEEKTNEGKLLKNNHTREKGSVLFCCVWEPHHPQGS